MEISEFLGKVNSTKDTIRYYEELSLIEPTKNGEIRNYSEEDINDFFAIKEMQSMGLTIREIQTILRVKRTTGYHSPFLLQGIQNRIYNSIKKIEKIENELAKRKMKLYGLLASLEKIQLQKEEPNS